MLRLLALIIPKVQNLYPFLVIINNCVLINKIPEKRRIEPRVSFLEKGFEGVIREVYILQLGE